MKLIIAIIQAYDSDRLLRAVTSVGLGATKIVSTGGYLRMTNATILMGVEHDRVGECLDIIREHCEPRAETSIDPGDQHFIDWMPIGVHEVTVGGAVVFIVPVSDYRRIMPAGVGKAEA